MADIALSYSRYSTYDKCPRQFDLKFNKKAFPDDSHNPHFIYGNEKHKEMDDHVKWRNRQVVTVDASDIKPYLSPESQRTAKIIEKLYDMGFQLFSERKFAIDKSFTPVDWFARNVFYRCIVDALAMKSSTAIAIDYKTGKVYPYDEYGGQLHLVATFILALFDQIQTVKASYLYMNHGQTISLEVKRNQLPELKEFYIRKWQEVNADKEFPPKANRYCHFCPATKAQCELK